MVDNQNPDDRKQSTTSIAPEKRPSFSSYLLVGIAIVIAALALYAFYADKGISIAGSSNSNSGTNSNALQNSLIVFDQKPGSTVTISRVILSSPGFVVIHKTDSSGQPGAIIGYSSALSGDNSNVTINLSESTIDGEQLIATLNQDNGNGGFDSPSIDLPIVGDDGKPIINTINISNTATDSVNI